jgi:DNA-binding winged helix-turn-helix (wHTH) protein
VLEAWIVGSDSGLARELAQAIGDLGHTPRRVLTAANGRVEPADGGGNRRPDVLMALVGRNDPWATDLCRLLDHPDGLPAALVVVVDERYLGRLPERLVEHELLVHAFSLAELDARIQRARVRFSHVGADEMVRAGSISVNLATYCVTVGEARVDCSNLEFQLLSFLLTHPGQVLSREALLYGVWGYDYFGGARTVDVHIRRLRAKLGPDAGRIKTVRGVGYLFESGAVGAAAAQRSARRGAGLNDGAVEPAVSTMSA